jgi:hypothetical protein
MIEVLKQALERIDKAIDEPNNTMSDGKALKEILRQIKLAKKDLSNAIAELEKQEPIAWLGKRDNGHFDVLTDQAGKKCFPVYTSPQLLQQEPVAMRYDFDGYGWKYIDSGSGSDWQTRIKDAEPLYTTKGINNGTM